MGPHSNDKCSGVQESGGDLTQTQSRRHGVRKWQCDHEGRDQSNIPQAKQYQGLLANTRRQKKQGMDSLLGPGEAVLVS